MLLSDGIMDVGIALLSAVEFATSLDGYVNSTCFVAGTMVLAIAGSKAIEKMEAGDLVYSTNPQTGESGYKEVVQTFENETDELVHVTVNGEEIVTTPTPPFYVPQKGWTSAIDLRAGDILVLSNGEYVTVEEVQHEILENPVKVYNFEVRDFHTYYVGENSVLVHNICKINESGNEEYYRSMSESDYDYLRMTREVPPTNETFISPTQSYSSYYDGVTVKFEVNGGTTNSLLEIGVSNNAKQAVYDYGQLPIVSGGWNAEPVDIKYNNVI